MVIIVQHTSVITLLSTGGDEESHSSSYGSDMFQSCCVCQGQNQTLKDIKYHGLLLLISRSLIQIYVLLNCIIYYIVFISY